MMIKPYGFTIAELVCPEVYHRFGERAWMFFDTKLLIVLSQIRERINKQIFVNNWQVHGTYTQRGLRCNLCSIVQSKTDSGVLYMSAHRLGKAVDFDVEGLVAEEVRQWIIKNKTIWAYPLRLEEDVNWVHMDLFDTDNDQKVTMFKS